MAKLTAWLVTLAGVLLILPLLGLDLASILGATINSWLIPVIVLIIGIGKLVRNYKKR